MLVALPNEAGEWKQMQEGVRQGLDQLLHQVAPLVQLHLGHLSRPGHLQA